MYLSIPLSDQSIVHTTTHVCVSQIYINTDALPPAALSPEDPGAAALPDEQEGLVGRQLQAVGVVQVGHQLLHAARRQDLPRVVHQHPAQAARERVKYLGGCRCTPAPCIGSTAGESEIS